MSTFLGEYQLHLKDKAKILHMIRFTDNGNKANFDCQHRKTLVFLMAGKRTC